jgi:hypothetical protein
MGTELVGNLPLQGGATVSIVSRVVQPPAFVIDRWKEVQAQLAQVGQPKAGAKSDLRALAGGEMPEDGCRFFVDLKIPDGPEDSP